MTVIIVHNFIMKLARKIINDYINLGIIKFLFKDFTIS